MIYISNFNPSAIGTKPEVISLRKISMTGVTFRHLITPTECDEQLMSKKKREFMQLFEPVHARFERFCKARAYGEMDFRDLMQESVSIAFEKFDTLKDNGAFLHFLFGIGIRVLANANRKMREERLPEKMDYSTNDRSAERQLEIDDLYNALGKLPEIQREALILFEISGFSIKEIAELQQSGESAVKQRLVRGRQALSEILTEKPQEIIV